MALLTRDCGSYKRPPMPVSYKTSLALWRKRRERILRLSKQGLTKSDIARRLGVSRQRVHQIVSNAD